MARTATRRTQGECFSRWLIEWVDQLGAVDLCRRVQMTVMLGRGRDIEMGFRDVSVVFLASSVE
jgi:hypothetical protein